MANESDEFGNLFQKSTPIPWKLSQEERNVQKDYNKAEGLVKDLLQGKPCPDKLALPPQHVIDALPKVGRNHHNRPRKP